MYLLLYIIYTLSGTKQNSLLRPWTKRLHKHSATHISVHLWYSNIDQFWKILPNRLDLIHTNKLHKQHILIRNQHEIKARQLPTIRPNALPHIKASVLPKAQSPHNGMHLGLVEIKPTRLSWGGYPGHPETSPFPDVRD